MLMPKLEHPITLLFPESVYISGWLGDDQWSQVGYVKSLYIYPVKSMAGIRVDTFNIEKTGPRKVFSLFQNILFISHFQKWTISRQTVHGC